ncbi:BAR adaptor protein Hob1 [Blastocladiella emersonii ATCC 22665]|nr:BAR adaptor protein Hob1 [Blastocladiella emersonii ATCC 22665]
MSWKGFVKAVQRLPHQVLARTGNADSTLDEEFEVLNAQFEALNEAASALQGDATKFKKAVETMLAHQHSFATTLLEVFSPIAAGTGASPVPSADGGTTSGSTSPVPSLARTRSLKRHHTPSESLEAVGAYQRNLEAVRDPILQDLSTVDRRIIQPTADLLEVFKAIRKTIVKRNHKLVDYDRHRGDVAKLRAAPAKDAKDERRLIQTEQSLQQATHEFAVLNDAIKAQLPQFLRLRVAFIDPCFQSLYLLQLKVYRNLAAITDSLRAFPQQIDFATPTVPGFQAKHAQVEDLINKLTILKFTPAALAAATAGQPLPGQPGAAPNGTVSPAAGAPGAPAGTLPQYTTLPTAGSKSPVPTMVTGVPTGSPYGAAAAAGGGKAAYAAPPTALAAGGLAAASMPVPKPAPPVPAAAPAVLKVVSALYDFEGQQADDLPFRAGDRIEVLEATDSQNDWWKGRCHSRTGFFPANYTQ